MIVIVTVHDAEKFQLHCCRKKCFWKSINGSLFSVPRPMSRKPWTDGFSCILAAYRLPNSFITPRRVLLSYTIFKLRTRELRCMLWSSTLQICPYPIKLILPPCSGGFLSWNKESSLTTTIRHLAPNRGFSSLYIFFYL